MSVAATPITIGTKTLKNRITMAPTVKFMAGEDGLVTEDFVKHYALRAMHQCALICVEATCVSKEGRLAPSQLGLWSDSQIDGHHRLTDACHAYDAVVIPQIHYGGLGTHPLCGPLTSPSKTRWRGKEAVELSLDEIHRIQSAFVHAAMRAQKAGYDGIQLHGCHSYLINDFASAINQRTDEYGGNTENRARFGAEIIRYIRQACGSGFLISTRVSGFDPTFEESVGIAEEYVKAGCDYLQVSSGIASLEELAKKHDDSLPYNFIADLGVKLHSRFQGRVPVSCVNGLRTPEQVHYLLEHALVDTVDLACGLLADPAFTEAILYGTPYQKCRSCGSSKGCCFGPMHAHLCPAMLARGDDEFGLHTLIQTAK